MRGRLWLTYFSRLIDTIYQEWDPQGNKQWRDSEWTTFLGKVMDSVAEKMNCYVVQRRIDTKGDSYEYLNIDAMFIDNAEYDLIENGMAGYDPFVLPRAVVELENAYDPRKISYSLWKILCVRSPIRVLICYQDSQDHIRIFKKRLEEVIWKGSFEKGSDGDLLILIGDESVENEKMPWDEYFTVYEWRRDRLETMHGPDWPDAP